MSSPVSIAEFAIHICHGCNPQIMGDECSPTVRVCSSQMLVGSKQGKVKVEWCVVNPVGYVDQQHVARVIWSVADSDWLQGHLDTGRPQQHR